MRNVSKDGISFIFPKEAFFLCARSRNEKYKIRIVDVKENWSMKPVLNICTSL
jgi:hypothetical protein